eukprot:scaffold655031_cov80-Prasinocladus_malaysianus.AAC.1
MGSATVVDIYRTSTRVMRLLERRSVRYGTVPLDYSRSRSTVRNTSLEFVLVLAQRPHHLSTSAPPPDVRTANSQLALALPVAIHGADEVANSRQVPYRYE